MGVGSFILPQTGGIKEWQRPTDWLPMPTNITSADQIFVGLHAVIENSDNYCAFSFTTSSGQYRVDWGDGNVTLHNSGTIAQYQYNFASISNSTISSRGYKQVIIKVTPVSGNFLTCNFQQRYITTPVQNQAYSSGFLECILSMPNASTGQSITFGGTNIRHSYCEKVEIKTIGNVTSMQGMFYNCYSLQSVPLFNTANVINMGSMFAYCYSLQSVPLFNTANVTSMSSMFQSCQSLNFIPAFITTAITTDFSNFINSCNSLNRILMSFNRTVGLQNCQLSKDALVEVFTNLTNRTATTSATIDITGNWGASALTSADRAIATNKNWVIIG